MISILTLCAILLPQEDDIAALLKLLSSKEPVISAHAEEALVDLGSRAIPHLERAEKASAPKERERLQRMIKEIREFEAGLESWETDRVVELLQKLDDRANLLQRRFSRRAGPETRVAAMLEREYGDKTGFAHSAYSFEFGNRDEGKTGVNDWDFLLTQGRLWLRTVSDDRSESWDVGETSFDKPDYDNPQVLKLPDRSEALKGRVYLIHTDDTNSNLWSKMQILERRPGQWILFRWERITKIGDLLKLERRPERLMKSGDIRIQIRAGHGGGNPVQVHADGSHTAYLEQMLDKPLDVDRELDSRERNTAFVQGGLIPLGKVWILRRAQIKATVHAQGEFRLSAKGQTLASRDRGAGGGVVDESWKGRIVFRPGEERSLFAVVAYFSRCDLTLSGVLWDERYADTDTFPELEGAEKQKAVALVKSLDSDDLETRERATSDLIAWGPPVLDYLQTVDVSKKSLAFQALLKEVIRRLGGD